MKKNPSQFIRLDAIYPEFEAFFDDNVLSSEKSKEWRITLDQAVKPEGLMTTKYKDFTIHFILTSSASLEEIVVKGPRIGRKNKFLEYALWIPYNPVITNPNPLAKLTEYFKQSVHEVLRRLEYPEESIQKTLEKITSEPIQ